MGEGQADSCGTDRTCRIVNGLLNEAELCEQIRAGLAADVYGPCVRHLLGGVEPAVELGDADCLVPQVIRPIHVDGRLPIFRFHIVVLGVLVVPFCLQLLCKMHVRLHEELTPVCMHQSNHVVVLTHLAVIWALLYPVNRTPTADAGIPYACLSTAEQAGLWSASHTLMQSAVRLPERTETKAGAMRCRWAWSD